MSQIKKFLLSFQLCSPEFPVIQSDISMLESLAFNQVENVSCLRGSYTPNNDYLFLLKDIPASKAPNFIMLVTAGIVSLSCSGSGGVPYSAVPVKRLFLGLLPIESTYKINNIYLEGRPTNSLYPMEQGTPVDYFLITATATF